MLFLLRSMFLFLILPRSRLPLNLSLHPMAKLRFHVHLETIKALLIQIKKEKNKRPGCCRLMRRWLHSCDAFPSFVIFFFYFASDAVFVPSARIEMESWSVVRMAQCSIQMTMTSYGRERCVIYEPPTENVDCKFCTVATSLVFTV